MAIRVMSWNINRFNQATLDRVGANEWYILEAVSAQQIDIFIVIEVQTDQGALGTLISGNGATGLLELLASLQVEEPAADWRLVPPPRLNDALLGPAYTEGIAVFYRNSTVTFTGPLYFNGANTVAVAGPTNVAYGGPWNNALPALNNRAPLITWVDHFGSAISFPNAGNRPPMMTTFTENANGRTVRVMAVHLPPDQATAARALPQITRCPAFLGGLGAADVAIAIGDFNYDPARETSVLAQTYYNGFTNPYNFRGFVAANGGTRIEKISLATPQLTTGGRRRYQEILPPRGRRTRVDHLDNAYIKYGANGPPGAPYNPTVVDMVAGTGVYPTTMFQTLAQILLDAQPDVLFQEDDNYGHIAHNAGVSDHLPIVVDIP